MDNKIGVNSKLMNSTKSSFNPKNQSKLPNTKYTEKARSESKNELEFNQRLNYEISSEIFGASDSAYTRLPIEFMEFCDNNSRTQFVYNFTHIQGYSAEDIKALQMRFEIENNLKANEIKQLSTHPNVTVVRNFKEGQINFKEAIQERRKKQLEKFKIRKNPDGLKNYYDGDTRENSVLMRKRPENVREPRLPAKFNKDFNKKQSVGSNQNNNKCNTQAMSQVANSLADMNVLTAKDSAYKSERKIESQSSSFIGSERSMKSNLSFAKAADINILQPNKESDRKSQSSSQSKNFVGLVKTVKLLSKNKNEKESKENYVMEISQRMTLNETAKIEGLKGEDKLPTNYVFAKNNDLSCKKEIIKPVEFTSKKELSSIRKFEINTGEESVREVARLKTVKKDNLAVIDKPNISLNLENEKSSNMNLNSNITNTSNNFNKKSYSNVDIIIEPLQTPKSRQNLVQQNNNINNDIIHTEQKSLVPESAKMPTNTPHLNTIPTIQIDNKPTSIFSKTISNTLTSDPVIPINNSITNENPVPDMNNFNNSLLRSDNPFCSTSNINQNVNKPNITNITNNITSNTFSKPTEPVFENQILNNNPFSNRPNPVSTTFNLAQTLNTNLFARPIQSNTNFQAIHNTHSSNIMMNNNAPTFSSNNYHSVANDSIMVDSTPIATRENTYNHNQFNNIYNFPVVPPNQNNHFQNMQPAYNMDIPGHNFNQHTNFNHINNNFAPGNSMVQTNPRSFIPPPINYNNHVGNTLGNQNPFVNNTRDMSQAPLPNIEHNNSLNANPFQRNQQTNNAGTNVFLQPAFNSNNQPSGNSLFDERPVEGRKYLKVVRR
jgi:hypothetical protein